MDQFLQSRQSDQPQFSVSEAESQLTFMLIKPDGLQSGLVGMIVQRIEKLGLRAAGMKLMHASADTISKHYSKHTNQPYFPGLLNYMTSGPIVAIAWKGPNAVSLVRKNITQESRQMKVATIRGDYSMHSAHYHKENNAKLPAKNVCHASENEQQASSEIGIWFPELCD